MSEILSQDNKQNSEFERWDKVLNASEENEGDSLGQKARALFETEYSGEKEFGPQGLVDYWTKLKDDLVKNTAGDLSEQSDEINKKMRVVREYLEKEVWGNELARIQPYELTLHENEVKSLIGSGVNAETIYSRVLMGDRNLEWTGSDPDYKKYGSWMQGTVGVNNVGYDILASSDFLPLMEGQGVDIDGNDILARTYVPDIIAENVETLCRYGVDIDVLINKIQDYPYAIAGNLDVLLSAGAKIDIDDLVASLNNRQKVIYLENLCKHGGKIDICELIESTWQEAEQEDEGKDVNDGWIDSRHSLIDDLMRGDKAIIKYGGRDAVNTLRSKLETLGLSDNESELLAEIPDEKIDEFGLSDEDKKRRLRKWEEINVTEADKEVIRNNNFNGVDVGLDLNKPADPEAEDKINYLLKTFCNLDSSGSVWSKSDLSERKRICTEMVSFLRERLGITMEARIVFSELNDNVGGHMGSTKDGRGLETVINSKHLGEMSSLYAIEAIAHETWHFYQIQCMLLDPLSSVGKIYNKNMSKYINNDEDEEKYMDQPLEEEAYRFGIMFRDYVKKLETKLSSEQSVGV